MQYWPVFRDVYWRVLTMALQVCQIQKNLSLNSADFDDGIAGLPDPKKSQP
jgi:hypothetical protein